MSYEVLEPTYQQLEKHLNQVTTIDEVLIRHTGKNKSDCVSFRQLC